MAATKICENTLYSLHLLIFKTRSKFLPHKTKYRHLKEENYLLEIISIRSKLKIVKKTCTDQTILLWFIGSYDYVVKKCLFCKIVSLLLRRNLPTFKKQLFQRTVLNDYFKNFLQLEQSHRARRKIFKHMKRRKEHLKFCGKTKY